MKKLITALAVCLLTCAALPAQDLQANSDALRAAVEGKKSAAEIKRLSVLVLNGAKKEMAPGADAEQAKYAQSVAEYAEYALYSASIGAPPATTVDLISTLEAEAPKSKYLNQDVYLMLANSAMTAQQADKAISYARKSLAAPKGAKPDTATGNAHYIIGIVSANKKDVATADKELKAALPAIKGNPSMEGPAYFFLGEADYQLGRTSMDRAQADAGIKYMLQAALISGQYQANASAEAKRMKAEMGEK